MKNGNTEGILIIIGIVILALIGSRGGISQNLNGQNSSSTPPRSSVDESWSIAFSGTNTNRTSVSSANSTYSRSISLNIGNARSEYQPSKEYVSIRNSGRDPISITGWQLKNGKDERTYYLNGQLQRFTADIAIIGQGTLLLSPTGSNAMRSIVLERGETAIITTGRPSSQLPYPIVSFKENMCTGYLDNMQEYTFTPNLDRNCPRPANEVGLANMDTECRKFVERLQSCQTPDFTPRDKRNQPCKNCVNGTPLSNACVAFIKERFNYKGCVAYHAGDKNFYGNTWRVFLGQGWEMYGTEYEKIKLFDQLGRPVSERSY